MSASQIEVGPIDWTDLPDDHLLGFGWKKRKDNLEGTGKTLKAADIEDFEKQSLDWEEQVDSVLGISSEEYERREEAIRATLDELEEERKAIDQNREFFDEAAELAEEHVKEVRQELGLEEAREQGWFSAEEAIQIDGFHYVHAQTWFPILEKTDEIEFEDDLQSISERALEADHAADAYQIDRELYEKITSDLEEPLQNFIAVGKLGEDKEYRQRVEQELKDSITDWVTSEDAEEYLEDLDSHLDWRTTERYVDLEELDPEKVEILKQNLNIDQEYEDTEEETILKYKLAQELASGRFEQIFENQFSNNLVDELREMQNSLQDKSRGRLIDSIDSPEDTELQDAISYSYRVQKWLWLSSFWQNSVEDKHGKSKIQPVHASLSRRANTISSYSQSKNIFPKSLLSSIDNLEIGMPNLRYWRVEKPVFEPDFPIDAYQQGMLYSSTTQGKSKVGERREDRNASLIYEFSNGKNSEIRKSALNNLFGEKGLARNEPTFYERENSSNLRFFSDEHSKEDINRQMGYALPGCLDFIRREINDDPLSYLEDENFAEGYVSQAIWERGYLDDENISFSPKEDEEFKKALETLNISYWEHDPSSHGRELISIPDAEIRKHEFLEEFQEAYLQSKN